MLKFKRDHSLVVILLRAEQETTLRQNVIKGSVI